MLAPRSANASRSTVPRASFPPTGARQLEREPSAERIGARGRNIEVMARWLGSGAAVFVLLAAIGLADQTPQQTPAPAQQPPAQQQPQPPPPDQPPPVFRGGINF